MKPFKNLLLLFCILCITPSVFGQHKKRVKRSNSMRFSFADAKVDSLDDVLTSDGFLFGGASLMNHVTTLGRDNNVNQWSFDPLLGFHKYNFDVYVNGFRWSQTTPKWAETDLGISKFWQISKSFSLVSTYEHAFVNYGTDDDKYGLNNLGALEFIWSNKFSNISTRYEYDWGRNCASILDLSIEHEWDIFDVFGKDKIEITPRFCLTYLGGMTYPMRFFKSNTLCPQPFQTANYEIELPFNYRKIGNFEWQVSFVYDMPKNVLPEEGSGKPIFYVTSTVVKVFKLRNKHK